MLSIGSNEIGVNAATAIALSLSTTAHMMHKAEPCEEEETSLLLMIFTSVM